MLVTIKNKMVDKAQDSLEQTVLQLCDAVARLEKRVSKLERGEHPHDTSTSTN